MWSLCHCVFCSNVADPQIHARCAAQQKSIGNSVVISQFRCGYVCGCGYVWVCVCVCNLLLQGICIDGTHRLFCYATHGAIKQCVAMRCDARQGWVTNLWVGKIHRLTWSSSPLCAGGVKGWSCLNLLWHKCNAINQIYTILALNEPCDFVGHAYTLFEYSVRQRDRRVHLSHDWCPFVVLVWSAGGDSRNLIMVLCSSTSWFNVRVRLFVCHFCSRVGGSGVHGQHRQHNRAGRAQREAGLFGEESRTVSGKCWARDFTYFMFLMHIHAQNIQQDKSVKSSMILTIEDLLYVRYQDL